MLFQGTFHALWASVTDVGWFGESGTDILFVGLTGRDTFTAKETSSVRIRGTGGADSLFLTQMQVGQPTVIKGFAECTGFLKADMVSDFF